MSEFVLFSRWLPEVNSDHGVAKGSLEIGWEKNVLLNPGCQETN